MRVLQHPGFHKTATTTAQAFLHENRALIWPHAALVLPARIRSVSEAVFAGGDVAGAMARFLRGLALSPRRTLILSAENLLGPMPRGGTDTPYPAALPVLRALISALGSLGWPVDLTLYFSTRAQAGWEESLWAHHARKDRSPPFTDSLAQFRARIGRLPLAEQLARIREGLPGQRIISHDIADLAQAPFGPAQPFVDFLGRAAPFRPVAPRNAALPRPVTERLLELNRRETGAALRAAKRAVRQAAEGRTA